MAATRQALALIALPVLTAILCRHFWKRPPTKRRALWAVAASFIFALYPPHACDAGRPYMQLLIGAICIAFLLTCITERRAAAILGVIFGLATLGLALNYDRLVHSSRYVGHQRTSHRQRVGQRESVKLTLTSEPAWTASPIPAGWIADDSRADEALKKSARSMVEHGEPLWHSWFTHLYTRRRTPMEIWYPGGPIEPGIHNLEWRERP